MMPRALVLAVVPLTAAAALSCTDTNHCPSGTQQQDVIPYTSPGRSTGFVCNPIAEDAPSAAPTSSTTPPFGPQAGAATAPPLDAGAAAGDGALPLPEACSVGSPGDLDVRVVTRSGTPPAPPSGGPAPPVGIYLLVQATVWAADGGVSPVADARAELAIEGARLVLTARGGAATVEAATATLAGGLITTVCRTAGPVTVAILPAAGASARAAIGWDGQDLELVVMAASGTFDLVFSPTSP
jgi:hypothetical protein